MKRLTILLLPLLALGLITPVFAELPYSHNAANTGSLCANAMEDDINPQAGFATLGGESSSDWNGLTLTSIKLQLCAGAPSPDSGLLQIGVFTPSATVQ